MGSTMPTWSTSFTVVLRRVALRMRKDLQESETFFSFFFFLIADQRLALWHNHARYNESMARTVGVINIMRLDR